MELKDNTKKKKITKNKQSDDGVANGIFFQIKILNTLNTQVAVSSQCGYKS